MEEEEAPLTLAKAHTELAALLARVAALEAAQSAGRNIEMAKVRSKVYEEIDLRGIIEPLSFAFKNGLSAELVVACLEELEKDGLLARHTD